MFTAASFLPSSNIYEVNIRQYTEEGTFKAFQHHLSRLQEMGVEILWIMPVHPIGKIKRKGSLGSYYSISDFKEVNPELGSAEDFKNLIEEVHARGMRIIMDWVANHAAWDNVWTKDHPDFFCRNENGEFLPPYDWDDVIQIDHLNSEEQNSMRAAMKFWIEEYAIDGFRADLAHLTPLQFWVDARRELQTIKHDLIWLAETEDISYHNAFDISFTWKWMHASENFTKQDLQNDYFINAVMESYQHFPKEALRLFFTSNHDENSWNGTEFEKYGKFSEAMAVCSCLLPHSVPLIYSGQEFSNNKRLKFFDKDQLKWNEGKSLAAFYKSLLLFRKESKIFKDNYALIYFPGTPNKIICFIVENAGEQFFVLLNFSENNFDAVISDDRINGNYHELFSKKEETFQKEIHLEVPSGGYNVFIRK